MPIESEKDSVGKTYYSAPPGIGTQETNAVKGVWLAPNEDADWVWTHLSNSKSYVSGYNIRIKIPHRYWN